ncbi:MAG: GGDEF domain-containing protein, partial [Ruminococcus sp.]|nr:GGDEF domain-containing protein [Ruminococcus sp.]
FGGISMEKNVPRKRLALLISDPSSDYSQSVIKGVRAQCAKYGYDLLVFSTMVKVCHTDKTYLDGELNIFRLINYDLVDGVLVASLELVEDQVHFVLERLEADLREKCRKPVVSLDLPFADYPTVYTDDRKAVREVVRHLVGEHGCRKIYMLTGQKDYVVSEARAEAFCEQMKAEGLEVSQENVFYGNFWYTGGEEFANRILSGEVAMPEAVVCANDYMAIGLANRLMNEGVKVPEQVRVTGYDATKDAIFNTVSITTYNPDVFGMAASAVDMIHEQISPDVPKAGIELMPQYGLRIGASCGCSQNADDLRLMQHGSNPNERKHNPDGSLAVNDMQGLHESYMFETLSVIKDKEQILQTITDVTYLLQPYRRFYLVLRSDWSDPESRCLTGYPETMRCVMRCIPQNESESDTERRYSVDSEEYAFPTERMLSALDEARDEPVVFYFLPSHFSDDTIGYAVLQTAMDAKRTADEVSTLWLRNVNNSLHMVRIVSKLTDYSIRDPMTGLLNRRGMEMAYSRRIERLATDEQLAVWVVDMDGLKYINDNFGHENGDFGIITIAEAIRMVSGKDDILVRTGGDEFVMIAAGRLTEPDGQERIRAFEQVLAEKNAALASRPFDITASIGFVCFPSSEKDALEEKLKEADRLMYEYKSARKKQRSN